MEKAKLESLGVSEEEMENLHDLFVEQHTSYFTEFAIDGEEPDAIIFDTEYYAHKAIWYAKPKGLEDQATAKYETGGKITLGGKDIAIHVDIYQHQTIQMENNGGPLMMWIGSKTNALQQLDAIYQQAGITVQNYLKFCPNIAKIEKSLPAPATTPTTASATAARVAGPTPIQQTTSNEAGFSIKDIKLGQEYDGYIKLTYNYGMFVTVK